MKILVTIITCLMCYSINAQTTKFKIDGTIENTKNAKFAYLSTLSQQIPISSDKIFMMVPVVNGKFEFRGEFDLNGKMMQHACIFFDERGNINKDELALKFKNLIWVTGRDAHLLRIVLENLSLQVKSRDDNYTAKVTKNGNYTKQYHEYLLSVKKGRKDVVNVIKKYPSSPISLIALQWVYFNGETYDSKESVSSIYDDLTSTVKTSTEGKALKKNLNIK